MPLGRGFATAVVLILVLLAFAALGRRLARERRLIAKLQQLKAFDISRAIRVDQLSEDERETVRSLTAAGVLRGRGNARYLEQSALKTLRRKRIGLVVSGALGGIIVVALAAFFILQR